MIVAIDPGTEKTGIALLKTTGLLVSKEIIMTLNIATVLEGLYGTHEFNTIVIGNGTNHRKVYDAVRVWIGNRSTITVVLVDEKFTTVEGRTRYWQYNPPQGWKKIIPLSFRYPPVPVDDFVAWIIGERYIKAINAHT